MAKTANPRDTVFPLIHRAAPQSVATVASTPLGEPGAPYAWTGNDFCLQWAVTVPTMAAGARADFSGSYPSKAFTHVGTNWLELVAWTGYPMVIKSAYVVSAPNLGLGSPGTFAELGIGLQAFDGTKTTKSTQWMERVTELDPGAASQYACASLLASNHQGALMLHPTVFSVLGLRVDNTDGSPVSFPGDILIVAFCGEIGQAP